MISRAFALRALIAISPAALGFAGCSREASLVCTRSTDYLDATEQGQLQIPDDLSIPDEVEALRIPGRPVTGNASQEAQTGEGGAKDCLELSPAFFVPDAE